MFGSHKGKKLTTVAAIGTALGVAAAFLFNSKYGKKIKTRCAKEVMTIHKNAGKKWDKVLSKAKKLDIVKALDAQMKSPAKKNKKNR